MEDNGWFEFELGWSYPGIENSGVNCLSVRVEQKKGINSYFEISGGRFENSVLRTLQMIQLSENLN